MAEGSSLHTHDNRTVQNRTGQGSQRRKREREGQTRCSRPKQAEGRRQRAVKAPRADVQHLGRSLSTPLDGEVMFGFATYRVRPCTVAAMRYDACLHVRLQYRGVLDVMSNLVGEGWEYRNKFYAK